MERELKLRVEDGYILWPEHTNGEVRSVVKEKLSMEDLVEQVLVHLDALEHSPVQVSREDSQHGTHPLVMCKTCARHIDIYHSLLMEFQEGIFAECTGPWIPLDHYPKN